MTKILIVDDIETNRRLLSKILLFISDFQVIEAVNGQQAIDVYQMEQPDLVLMDINMPVMNGYQSASAMKAIAGDCYIPIIFVTALTAEASLSNALASGGDDFISKPFNVQILESKINAHLRIRELNRSLNDKNKQLMQFNNYLRNEQELIEHFFKTALSCSFLDEKFIQYHMSSLSTFNGDVFLVERGPLGGLYIIMGDFTGHGLSAAIGTLPIAMIFFRMVAEGIAIGDIAIEMNKQLNKLLPPDLFFAATLLQLNASGQLLSVWMGGMPDCYWLDKNGHYKGQICSQHMPLGILKDEEFDASTSVINVEVGDKIYLYSDGVIESSTADGKVFGEQRLKEILVNSVQNRFQTVLSELKKFKGISDQNDDLTLVELTCEELSPIIENTQEPKSVSPQLPWHFSVSLSTQEIQKIDPVSCFLDQLVSIPSLSNHKGTLYILISEIYSNVLEHSILNLDSSMKVNEEQFSKYYEIRKQLIGELNDAFIKFNFAILTDSKKPALYIKVEDSGSGYKGYETVNSSDLCYGRGIDIIHGLCEKVAFSPDGKVLEVYYLL